MFKTRWPNKYFRWNKVCMGQCDLTRDLDDFMTYFTNETVWSSFNKKWTLSTSAYPNLVQCCGLSLATSRMFSITTSYFGNNFFVRFMNPHVPSPNLTEYYLVPIFYIEWFGDHDWPFQLREGTWVESIRQPGTY